MMGTIIGFAIVAFFWHRARMKDKDKRIRAYADFRRLPDGASTVVAFLILVILMYLSVFLPMPLFIFTPLSEFAIFWPIVTFFIIGLSWGFTRRIGYIRLPGNLNMIINNIVDKFARASNKGFAMRR